jgi:hypothetical protein
MATESEYKQRDALDYVRVTVAAETNVKSSRIAADIHALKLPDPALLNRRFLLVRNDGAPTTGSTVIYIGGADVTDKNGYPLVDNQSGASYKSQRVLLNVSSDLIVYGIKEGAPVEEFRTLELA